MLLNVTGGLPIFKPDTIAALGYGQQLKPRWYDFILEMNKIPCYIEVWTIE